MTMSNIATARRVVFAGGNSHQRADERFGVEAAEVKFTYGPEESVDVSKIEAAEVKFSYAPEQPSQNEGHAGVKAAEVKFSYAPDAPEGDTPVVGCPCGTL